MHMTVCTGSADRTDPRNSLRRLVLRAIVFRWPFPAVDSVVRCQSVACKDYVVAYMDYVESCSD